METTSVTLSNLTLRLFTAFLGAPLVVALIILSWWTSTGLWALAIVLAWVEYRQLIEHDHDFRRAFNIGILYLGLPLMAGAWLRSTEDGAFWMLLMLFTNWLTDTGAYIAGRWLGDTPLAPQISPNKTWEGAIGGVVTGFTIAIAFTAIVGHDITIAIVLIAIFVPIASIAGDLFESRLKRIYGVKDSGNLLPGHGGVLDRIDGTLFSIIVVAAVVFISG